MKIGILLISRGFAGLERAMQHILENLANQNNVLLFLNDEMKEYYEGIENVKIFSLGPYSTKNLLSIKYSLYNLRKNLSKFLSQEKIDILSVQSSVSMTMYAPLIKQFYIPLVPTFHGTDIKNFLFKKSLLYSFTVKRMISKILNNSQRITSVSNHQIQNLAEKYKQKTIIVPNGVDSKIFRPLKNIKQKENILLFTGRFIGIKGIKEIINVAKELPQYEFWFAGQGELEYLIMGGNVKNLGFNTTKNLVRLYNQSTICIFPSYREGLPLCGLEAMSCGKAVIATPLGFSEYIENGKEGIIIPAKDENALKNAILDLMTNKKKRKMIEKNARKKALKYSWDKVAKKYLEVFEKAIIKTPKLKILFP